jgi:hypothetical protein
MAKDPPHKKKALLTEEAVATLGFGGVGLACLSMMLIGGVFIVIGLLLAIGCAFLVVVLHWAELCAALHERRFSRHAALPLLVVFVLLVVGALLANKDAILAWHPGRRATSNPNNAMARPPAPTPHVVYPPFGEAYALHPELGAPISDALPTRMAYEGWTQHAYTIWLTNPGVACAFHDSKQIPGFCEPDAGYSQPANPELYDRKYVDDHIGLSVKDYFPRGSFAEHLIYEPNKWGWIGKYKIECDFESNEISFQSFTWGTIYGVFRKSPANDDNDDGMVFVAVTNGAAVWEPTRTAAPKTTKCDTDGEPSVGLMQPHGMSANRHKALNEEHR